MIDKRSGGAVSISPPKGFAAAFKKLAAERTAANEPERKKRYVSAQELHEEAVRDLLDRLANRQPVVFAPTFRKRRRKAMWLDSALYAEAKEAAQRCEVSVSTLVLTACLAYLEAHGIELDTSPTEGRSDV
jgi:hypothetical protein